MGVTCLPGKEKGRAMKFFRKNDEKYPTTPVLPPPPPQLKNLPYLTFIWTDWPDHPHRNENFIFNQNYQTLLIVCTKMVFHQISWKKPISLSEWPVWQWFGQPVWPKESTPSFFIYWSIYFGHSHTDLRSVPHSCLLAMTGARSCPERLVSLPSRSMNIVAGCPLEYLPCFDSQSWETVSFLVLQQWPLNCSRQDCCHISKNF